MEPSRVLKKRSTPPLVYSPLVYSPSNTDSIQLPLETKPSNLRGKNPAKDSDHPFSLIGKGFVDPMSKSLGNQSGRSPNEEETRLKPNAIITPKTNEPIKPPIYSEYLNKSVVKTPAYRLPSDEEEIITKSYGKLMPRISSIEEEFKQKQTEDERSLISSSAYSDSPRIYPYSENSANESPRIDSSIAGSGNIILPNKVNEIKFSTIGEKSLVKSSSMDSIPQKADENAEVIQKQVQYLSNIVERLEGEIQRRFQTMQSDMLTFSEQLSQAKVENEGLKHLRQIEDTTLRNFEQRIAKSEQVSNDRYKILEDILREISDRVELLENKEEGKIKLFEELGYDIESLREDYKGFATRIDNIQKEFFEKIDFFKHEIVTPSQIELLTSAHRKEITTVWNEIGKYNDKLNSQVEDLDRIRSQQYDTQISIIKKDLDNLRNSLNLKYDSFPGMIEERLRESNKVIQDVQNRIEKLEASNLEDSEANAAMRAYKSFETRLNQIETKTIRVGQHDLSETQKLLKKENAIISKLDDRVSQLEKEAKSMKNLKRKLAHMIRNFNATEKGMDLPLSMNDLRKKPGMSNPSMQVQLETTKEEEITPDPHSFASTPVYRSTARSGPKIIEEEYQDPAFRQTFQQVLFTQSDSRPNLEDKLSYMEKMNIHKKAMESITAKSPMQTILTPPNIDIAPNQFDLRGYLPGEAESVVLSAILDKTNRTRASENLRISYGNSFKPLSPLSCSFTNLARYSEKAQFSSPNPSKSRDKMHSSLTSFQPSDQLREHLKLKGFKIKDNKPILRY